MKRMALFVKAKAPLLSQLCIENAICNKATSYWLKTDHTIEQDWPASATVFSVNEREYVEFYAAGNIDKEA